MSKSRQNSNVPNRLSVADRTELLTKTGTREGEVILQRDIGLLYAWTDTQGTDPGGSVDTTGLYITKGGSSFSEGGVKVNRQRNCKLGSIFAAGYAATDEVLKVENDANTSGFYDSSFSNPAALITIEAANFGKRISSIDSGKNVPIVYTVDGITASLTPVGGQAVIATIIAGETYLCTAVQSGAAAGIRATAIAYAHSNNTINIVSLDSALASWQDAGTLQLAIQNDHPSATVAFKVHILKIGEL